MEQSNPEQLTISVNKDVPVDTRFKFLTANYYFHQLIRRTELSSHFLAEEIMNETDKAIYYYLKQMKCTNKQDHHEAIDYYTKFLGYCGLQTAKKHIVKLVRMHEYEERDESYFELVLVFQFGESDRIDIEIMEPEQVLRFIKNVCVLLNDVSTHAHIYHCNLSLKNIVICNEEPSISGFKPIFMNGPLKSWKQRFAHKFGMPRLEVFCVGLLWLNFLNVSIDGVVTNDKSVEDIERELTGIVSELPELQKTDLLAKLLKPSEFPSISQADVVLEFDQYFILERISRRMDSSSNRGSDPNNSFDAKLDQQVEYNSKMQGFLHSDASSNKASQKEDLNLFTKNLKELVDQDTYSDLDKKSAEHSVGNGGSLDFKTNPEFTVAENFSVVRKEGNAVRESRLSAEEISNKGGESRNFLIGESGMTLKGKGSEHQFASVKESKLNSDKDEVFKTASASLQNNESVHGDKSRDRKVLKEALEEERPTNGVTGHPKESKSEEESAKVVEVEGSSIDVHRLMASGHEDGPRKEGGLVQSKDMRISDKLGVTPSKVNSSKDSKGGVRETKEGQGQLKKTTNDPDEGVSGSVLGTKKNTIDKVRNKPTTDDPKKKEVANEKGRTADGNSQGGVSRAKVSKQTLLDRIHSSPIEKPNDPKSSTPSDLKSDRKGTDEDVDRVAEGDTRNPKSGVVQLTAKKTVDEKGTKRVSGNSSGVPPKSSQQTVKLKSDSLFKKHTKPNTQMGDDQFRLENRKLIDDVDDHLNDDANDFDDSRDQDNSVIKIGSEEAIKNTGDFLSMEKLEGVDSGVEESVGDDTQPTQPNQPHQGLSLPSHALDEPQIDQGLFEPAPLEGPLQSVGLHEKGLSDKFLVPLQPHPTPLTVPRLLPSLKHPLKPLFHKQPIELNLSDRTKTNLFPEIVERMLEKRQKQNLLKVKSEKLFKQMKAKEEVEKMVKLEQQDQAVQALVEKSLQAKIKREVAKTESQKRLMDVKDQERLLKDHELFDKIRRKAEERHRERKREQFERYRDKREYLSRTAKEHQPFEEFKKHRADSVSQLTPTPSPLPATPATPGPAVRLTRNVSENNLAPKRRRDFNLSPIDAVDRTFQFNHHHQVFRIPFRRVVQGFVDDSPARPKDPSLVRKSGSVSVLSKSKQRSVLDKFEETLERYKNSSGFLANQDRANDGQPVSFKAHSVVAKTDFNSVDVLNQFLEKGFLSKQMKSIGSDNTQQFWSAGQKQFLDENDRNPLELSHVRHLDYTNDALLNPVKEWKDLTIFKHDRVYQPALANDAHDLAGFARYCQANLTEDKLDDVLERIQQKSAVVDQKDMVELNKVIASVFFCLDMPEKAKEELLNAVENIKELRDSDLVESFLGETVFNLAFLEFCVGDIRDSVEMLKNDFVVRRFKDCLGNILGNAFMSLNRPKEARELFQAEAKKLTLQEPTSVAVIGLYQYVCKVLECFKQEKNKMGPAEFFRDIEDRLARFSTVFKQLDKNAPRPYDGLVLLVLMRFLHFGQQTANLGMMNYVLERAVKSSTLSPTDRVPEPYKQPLCVFLLSVCDYLKSKPKYGGFEANFCQYLDLAAALSRDCPLTVDSLRLHCSVQFSKGLYKLQKGNKSEARDAFRLCFDVVHQLFKLEEKPAFEFVHGLAKAFLKKNDLDNALFFYEELHKFDLADTPTSNRLQLQLAKVLFRKQSFARAADVVGSFLDRAFTSPALPSPEEKLLRWACLFRLCCLLSDDTKFDHFKASFEQRTVFSRSPVSLQYCVLFRAMESLVKSPGPADENTQILRYLESVVHNKALVQSEKGAEVVDFVSVVFSKFSKDKLSILHLLKDENATDPQNVATACEFVENATVHLLLAFKTSPEMGFDDKVRLAKSVKSEVVRNEIRQAVVAQWNVVESVERQYISLKVGELKGKLAAEVLSANKERDLGVFLDNKAREELPDRSRDILRRSHFNRAECACSAEDQQTYSPTKLIEQFLKQLKNMLFLDVTEDVLAYYQRFEAIIKEKGWNWNKFSYIPLLFNCFRKAQLDHDAFDQLGLLRILDEVFNSLPLCVHDIKMVVLLLESFKRVQFLEVFVVYLHRMQPGLAGLVFNWMFLENFTAKFDQILTELYRRLYAFQFHHLENFSLMHLLSFESVLKIEKNLAFQMYQRFRYDVLADPKFKEVFTQYIDSKTLAVFALRHESYRAIVTMLRNPKQSQTELLKRHQDRLFQCAQHLTVDSENYRYFTYDFYVVLNFINLKSHPESVSLIVQTLHFLKRKVPTSFAYHFAVLASLVGNYFFKFKLYRETVAMKTLVLEVLNSVDQEPSEFPQYVTPVSLRTLLFSTLSFLFFSFWELKVEKQAEVMFNKLMMYDYENEGLNLEKDLVGVYQLYAAGELERAMANLIKSKVDFETMQLKPRLLVMFQAAFDRLDYLISEQMEEAGVAEAKRRKSEGSLARLLKPVK